MVCYCLIVGVCVLLLVLFALVGVGFGFGYDMGLVWLMLGFVCLFGLVIGLRLFGLSLWFVVFAA